MYLFGLVWGWGGGAERSGSEGRSEVGNKQSLEQGNNTVYSVARHMRDQNSCTSLYIFRFYSFKLKKYT